MFPDYLHFNENYNLENGKFYVVPNGKTFVQAFTKFWTSRDFARKRVSVSGDIFIFQMLRSRKRAWKPCNYTERKYRLVVVGTKDRTTHLPEGEIYQLSPELRSR